MGDFTHEEFVRVWQTANSVIEVAGLLDISPRRARETAGYFRKNGVPLKRYRHKNKYRRNWASLAKLALELLDE